MERIGVGIIGCGSIFGVHADAVKKSGVAELTAVADIRENTAKEAAARYGCDFYTDYREMLRDPRIQAVHICTPHHLHASMAIDALMAGKHVLTEKPVAVTLREADEMARTARDCGKHLAVCFQNRFNPTSVKAKEVIDSGMLGKIKGIKGIVTWYRNETYYTESGWRGDSDKAGGGVLINQALHTLDLMQWFGGEVERIKGHADTRCFGGIIEVEDTAEATIYFKNGARGIFYATVCFTDNSPVVIEIHCEKGMLTILDGELYITRNGERELLVCDELASGEKAYWGLSHEKLIKHFYGCLLHDTADYIKVPDAAVSIEMAMGIYESSANGCEYIFRGTRMKE
jgi:UDP-N-acetyl-2-amino-2-deoxyglucuronate dehydrogenase